jgi:hypothetical protein
MILNYYKSQVLRSLCRFLLVFEGFPNCENLCVDYIKPHQIEDDLIFISKIGDDLDIFKNNLNISKIDDNLNCFKTVRRPSFFQKCKRSQFFQNDLIGFSLYMLSKQFMVAYYLLSQSQLKPELAKVAIANYPYISSFASLYSCQVS